MDFIIKEVLEATIPKPSSSDGDECINGEDKFLIDNGEDSNRKVKKKLWIIGDSEVSMFQREKDIFESKWEMQLKTDFASGRTLQECFQFIRIYMNSEVDMIILWTLTSTAWKERTICEGGQQINIIGPGPSFRLENIVQQMRDIDNYVKSVKSNCNVFLIVPTVKDMFHYNVERMVEKLGNKVEAVQILQQDIVLNSKEMQEYSISVYNKFMALITNEYQWPNKLVWVANNVIDKHYKVLHLSRFNYENTNHNRYLNRRLLTLDIDILPDGFHGNRRFVKMFAKCFAYILTEYFRLKTHYISQNSEVVNTTNSQILNPESCKRNEMRSPINVARRDRSVSPRTRNLEPSIFSISDTQNSPITSELPTRERIKQRYKELPIRSRSRSSRTSEMNHRINHNISPDPKILLLQKSINNERHIQARVEEFMTEIIPANSTDKISELDTLDPIAAVRETQIFSSSEISQIPGQSGVPPPSQTCEIDSIAAVRETQIFSSSEVSPIPGQSGVPPPSQTCEIDSIAAARETQIFSSSEISPIPGQSGVPPPQTCEIDSIAAVRETQIFSSSKISPMPGQSGVSLPSQTCEIDSIAAVRETQIFSSSEVSPIPGQSGVPPPSQTCEIDSIAAARETQIFSSSEISPIPGQSGVPPPSQTCEIAVSNRKEKKLTDIAAPTPQGIITFNQIQSISDYAEILSKRSRNDQRFIQEQIENILIKIVPDNDPDHTGRRDALDAIIAMCIKMKR